MSVEVYEYKPTPVDPVSIRAKQSFWLGSQLYTREVAASAGNYFVPDWELQPVVTYNTMTGTSPGSFGQMVADDTNLYVCIGTNSWKKVALSTI